MSSGEHIRKKILLYSFPPFRQPRYVLKFNKEEFWIRFGLFGGDGEYIKCKVNYIVDENRTKMPDIAKYFDFKTVFEQVKTDNNFTYERFLIIPSNLKYDYPIQTNRYLDLDMTEIRRPSGSKTQIYPKMKNEGEIDIDLVDEKEVETPLGRFLDVEFNDPFYLSLKDEINKTYRWRLYTSTSILLRKLFENLLIDLLRNRYGNEGLELFYSKSRGRHYGLGTLTDNLHNKAKDFEMISKSFDESFFRFLQKIREQGDAQAHSIDIVSKPEDLDSNKKSVNEYCQVLWRAIPIALTMRSTSKEEMEPG